MNGVILSSIPTRVKPLIAMDLPLVSVITVVRDGAATIACTLESVRSQCDVDVEHVIVDGDSLDGTVEIIKAYRRDRLRWISEPDQGIYDAMNKGISLARGEWLLFLGADDILADASVLADIFQDREVSSYDLVCGCSSYHGGRKSAPRLDWHTRVFNTLHHQAAFYRRRLFDNFRYRIDIPVVADYELNFLIYSQHRPALFLDRHISISGDQGVSHTSSQSEAQVNMFKMRSRYISLLPNVGLLSLGFINLALTKLIRAKFLLG